MVPLFLETSTSHPFPFSSRNPCAGRQIVDSDAYGVAQSDPGSLGVMA